MADRLVEDALVEDRRTVTAVFADLLGFHRALAGSLEPVELARVIDPVVAGLTRIVDRYGGAVEKFAGDAILAFFGAPIAHEDDAERAVMAALEMHEQLSLFPSHPAAQTLSLHVGINTGEVYARMAPAPAGAPRLRRARRGRRPGAAPRVARTHRHDVRGGRDRPDGPLKGGRLRSSSRTSPPQKACVCLFRVGWQAGGRQGKGYYCFFFFL
ncbi:MAG: adenylate/guanylate cyclase domain-containing protein [Candidatus Nanopelagicales bacterium]